MFEPFQVVLERPGGLQTIGFLDPALPGSLRTIAFVDPTPPGDLQTTIFVDPRLPGGLETTRFVDPTQTGARLHTADRYEFSAIFCLKPFFDEHGVCCEKRQRRTAVYKRLVCSCVCFRNGTMQKPGV